MEGTQVAPGGQENAQADALGLRAQIRSLVREEVERLVGGPEAGSSPASAPSGTQAPDAQSTPDAQSKRQKSGAKPRLPLGTAALRAAERKIHERLARNLKELQAVLRETEAIAREMEALLARTPDPGGSPGGAGGRSGSGSGSQGAP